MLSTLLKHTCIKGFIIIAAITTTAQAMSTEIPVTITELAEYYNNGLDEANAEQAAAILTELNQATFTTTQQLKNLIRDIIYSELLPEQQTNRNIRISIATAINEFCDTTNNTCTEPGNRLSSPMGKLTQKLRASTDSTLSALSSALSARSG